MDLNRPEAMDMVNNTYAINVTDTRHKPPIPPTETVNELRDFLKVLLPPEHRIGGFLTHLTVIKDMDIGSSIPVPDNNSSFGLTFWNVVTAKETQYNLPDDQPTIELKLKKMKEKFILFVGK